MRFPLWIVVLAGLSVGLLVRAYADSVERRADARSIVADWPDSSRAAANLLLERYGTPDAAAPGVLVWGGRAPWRRIALWRRGPDVDEDFLEQTAAYAVPREKAAALAGLRGCVRVSDDGEALSARSSDERLNRLALNLAAEVLRGVKTPEEARIFYDATVTLAAAGRSSRYMDRLFLNP